MRPGRRVLSIWTAMTFLALAGCSNPLPRSGQTFDFSPRRAVGAAAARPVAENIAAAALNTQTLASIRGGFSGNSGIIVTFSFQEATFVNDNLAHSLDRADLHHLVGFASCSDHHCRREQFRLARRCHRRQRDGPGSTELLGRDGSVDHKRWPHAHPQQHWGRGVSNTISNRANDQLVEQVITANIDINGLSKLLEPSLAG